jgi:CRP-like cAMP-binding protein
MTLTQRAERHMNRSCGREPRDVLANQPLFASLEEDELRLLAERSLCRRVSRGAQLFREGEPCRGLYLVLEGRVRVYRASSAGEEQVLFAAGAGESLGEAALFDGGPYLASAQAQTDSHLLFLPLREVHALYGRHPAIAHCVVKDMGRRLREMIALVGRLSLQDVPTRVAASLLHYAEGSTGGLRPGASFRLPRTQEELARELGTTRESVARSLKRFRAEGVIRQSGATVEILNAGALRQAASGTSPARGAAE